MGTKPSEHFHRALIAQYKDMIHEALIESDHKLFLDVGLFIEKLDGIVTAAVIDGLSESEIYLLVDEVRAEISTLHKVG